MPEVLHQLPKSSRAGMERGHPDQGLPPRGLRHQVHGGHLGVPQDGERGGEVRGIHPGLDEADPGAAA